MKDNQRLKYTHILSISLLVITGLLLTACGGASKPKTYIIGVVNNYSVLEEIIEGFKAGMAELGYVEGENVTYIYNGATEPDDQALDAEIENLLDQEVDLLLTVSPPATLRAQQAVEGTDVPVLFALILDPVGWGVVESLNRPGGNVTGVQFTNAFPKALEWLLAVAPETTQVYVPYIPIDATPDQLVEEIARAAAALGVEAVVDEAQSLEEVVAAIETLPKDAAILGAPSPALTIDSYIQVATERGIAVGGIGETDVKVGALVAYGIESFSTGKQAARMADQILQGIDPADLPVEAAEHYLSINLKTAQAIGLDIPDEILRQADTIIR